MLSRFFENVSFGISSAAYICLAARPSVAYVNTWPIVASALAVWTLRFRGVPVVLSVQDVYPESLVVQGRIRKGGVIERLLRKIDTQIAKRACRVVLITNKFVQMYLSRGIDKARLRVVPNWIRGDTIDVSVSGERIRKELGIPLDSRLSVYAGNVSIAAGVDRAIRAFSELRQRFQCYFVVAGEGGDLERCRDLADELNLRDIRFLAPWPVADTSEVLRAADVLVLPTGDGQSEVSVPSKLIAYLLSGRPVLAMASQNSELERTLIKSGGGWVTAAGKPRQFSAKWQSVLSLDHDELDRIGKKGRMYALEHLVESANLPALMEIIKGCAEGDSVEGGWSDY